MSSSGLSFEQWMILGVVIAAAVTAILHLVTSSLRFETDLLLLKEETRRLREEFLRRKFGHQEIVEEVGEVDIIDEMPPLSIPASDDATMERLAA